jgi:hypothetical protein
MAFQFGTTLRNNRIGQLQTTIGGSAVLKIFSGAEPANPAAADPTGLLLTITLPATFLTSSGGVASLAGTWSANASATGTAATFRIYDGSAVCHIQGNVTATGGGGDMTLDNVSIASGQTITVTSFTVTDGNA